MKTDRYVRQGGPIPQIYPGNLDSLNKALDDCASISKFLTNETVSLTAVQGSERTLIRVFRNGHPE